MLSLKFRKAGMDMLIGLIAMIMVIFALLQIDTAMTNFQQQKNKVKDIADELTVYTQQVLDGWSEDPEKNTNKLPGDPESQVYEAQDLMVTYFDELKQKYKINDTDASSAFSEMSIASVDINKDSDMLIRIQIYCKISAFDVGGSKKMSLTKSKFRLPVRESSVQQINNLAYYRN